jgi:hypothetical protein
METLSLFVREPVSLEGFVPPFSKEETLLGYNYDKSKVFRGLGWNGDDDEPDRYVEQWSITVCGQKFVGRMDYYSGSSFDIAFQIARDVITSGAVGEKANIALKWLKENEKDLLTSVKYWKAISRLDGIKETEARVKELEQRLKLARVIASIEALEILEDSSFSQTDIHRLSIEFGLTDDEYRAVYQR